MSAAKSIQMILARQLASSIATPILLVDPSGALIFYNEPAEPILGKRFDETGEILVVDLPHIFYPTDEEGTPLPTDVLAAGIALFERRPAYHRVWIRGLDGVRRHLEVTAFPIIGQADRFLGIIVLLWEISA